MALRTCDYYPGPKLSLLILQQNQDFFVPDDTSRALMPKC
jgi:hypothetical protein